MNDIRRGNPKKRFLWRRLLPRSDEYGNNDNEEGIKDEGVDNNSSLSIKFSCSNGKNDFQSASSVVSPPPSPLFAPSEEGDSRSSVLLTRAKKTTQQAVPKKEPVSESSSSQQKEAENERLSNDMEGSLPTREMVFHDMPRPFLASIDPPPSRPSIGGISANKAIHTLETGSSSAKLPKPCGDDILDMSIKSTSCSDDSSDIDCDGDGEQGAEGEEDSFQKTRLVLSTAASVLLLMRFSVTDKALDSLTSGSQKSEDKKEATKEKQELTTKTKPASPEPEATVSSTTPSIPVVTPDKPKLCIRLSRRVSFEDASHPCPNRLAMPEDPNELNSLHCFVRAHLLEVFSLPAQKDKPGRVGLRCVFCSHLPRKDRSGTTMCTFYPKSLQDLYRSVMTWQRIHFRGCKHVSPNIKEEYWKHKESDQTRGKTTYWVTSAMRLGLQDINNGRNGICFVCPQQSSRSD